MADLIFTTFDWVPEIPRGYVRDLRVRWAPEEAGFESTPFRTRGAEYFSPAFSHLHQGMANFRPQTPLPVNQRGNVHAQKQIGKHRH